MERIQFYPSADLKKMMQREAENKGLSLSQLTVDIIVKHYGLAVTKEEKRPISVAIDEVIEEVKSFVCKNKTGTEFDLLTASDTFKNIHMVADGKPSTNRATVGKVFASKLGKNDFKNIAVVRTESGAVKKSVNRATLYVIL